MGMQYAIDLLLRKEKDSSPFGASLDPPLPPKEGPADIAKNISLGLFWGTIIGFLYKLFGGLLLDGAFFNREKTLTEEDIRRAEKAAGLEHTSAPAKTENNLISCTKCGEKAPFEAISVNEDGYFCAQCSDQLRRQQI